MTTRILSEREVAERVASSELSRMAESFRVLDQAIEERRAKLPASLR